MSGSSGEEGVDLRPLIEGLPDSSPNMHLMPVYLSLCSDAP